MRLSRWLGLLGSAAMVVMAVTLLAVTFPVAMAAAPRKPPPETARPTCPTSGGLGASDIRRLGAIGNTGARVSSVALLSPQGEETGRRVVAELAVGSRLEIELPAESFVAGPFGEVLVYGSHDGSGSSDVRLVDLTTGCAQRVITPRSAVRSAILGPAGESLFVHTVSYPERRDGGVVRYDIATGEEELVVEPLPESDVFGPTFATTLAWSESGDELAVQSCGFSSCRTRVLDLAGEQLHSYAGTGHGALVGLTRQTLFAFDACHWSPCAVLAISRASGATTTLVEEAYAAKLVETPNGVVLAAETAAGTVEVAP